MHKPITYDTTELIPRVQFPMRPRFRRLHMESGIWQYRISGSHIMILSPTGLRYDTDESQVTGMSWGDIERGYWKGGYDGIKPSYIRDWIVQHITSKENT